MTGVAMGLGIGVLNAIPGTEKVSEGMGKAANFLPMMGAVETMDMMGKMSKTKKNKKYGKW